MSCSGGVFFLRCSGGLSKNGFFYQRIYKQELFNLAILWRFEMFRAVQNQSQHILGFLFGDLLFVNCH